MLLTEKTSWDSFVRKRKIGSHSGILVCPLLGKKNKTKQWIRQNLGRFVFPGQRENTGI